MKPTSARTGFSGFLAFTMVASTLGSAAAFADGQTLHDSRVRLDAIIADLDLQTSSQKRMSIGFGIGGAVGFGAGAFVASRSDNADTRSRFPLIWGIAAGLSAASGVMGYVMESELEKDLRVYRELSGSEADRVSKGEEILKTHADKMRSMRIMSSVSLTVLGAVAFGIGVAGPANSTNEFYGAIGAASVGGGIAGFFSESPIEARLRHYKEWNKDRKLTWLEQSQPRLALAPMPKGAWGGVSLKF